MANTPCPFESRNKRVSFVVDDPEIDEISPESDTLESSLRADQKKLCPVFSQASTPEIRSRPPLGKGAERKVVEAAIRESTPQCKDRNHKGGLQNTANIAQSIFDLHKPKSTNEPYLLPQIITVFASQADKLVFEKETKNCVLPAIHTNHQAGNILTEIAVKESFNRKGAKAGLFDFRARALQEKARKRHIRRLQKRGYEITARSESKPSRFISKPYEGAVDDIACVSRKSARQNSAALSNDKALEAKNAGTPPKSEISPPADEETLAKIEAAFAEWKIRKEKFAERSFYPIRKRSSSHSPPRSTQDVFLERGLSNSCSNSFDFLNQSGNFRRPKRPDSAKPGVSSSPTASRSRFSRKEQDKAKLPIATRPVPTTGLSIKQRFEGKSSSPTPPSKTTDQHKRFRLRNKRLAEIQSGEISFSSSLPDLKSKLSSEMESKSHRPRSSSLKKTKQSTTGKSPKPQRKGNLKASQGVGNQGDEIPSKEVKLGARRQRKVVINTTLPTGSPSFQRAMKTMEIPDREYCEIFGQRRRDSIIQRYTLTENALNSFRDDNDLKMIESSSNALDRMTEKFQEDLKLYKDSGDLPKQQKMVKSIIKKRKQSVDDLDIGTRKNLAKYLESKMEKTIGLPAD